MEELVYCRNLVTVSWDGQEMTAEHVSNQITVKLHVYMHSYIRTYTNIKTRLVSFTFAINHLEFCTYP